MPRVHRTGRPFPYDRVETVQLPPGDAGTRATLAAMARLARDAAGRPDVIEEARGLMHAGPRGPHLYAVRLFDALRRRVTFQRDPPGQELVRHPSQLLSEIRRNGRAFGDCDDRATLGAALLLAARIPAAFVVIGRDRLGEMEHVYYAAKLSGSWVPFDPQEVEQPGRELPHKRRWLYPI